MNAEIDENVEFSEESGDIRQHFRILAKRSHCSKVHTSRKTRTTIPLI